MFFGLIRKRRPMVYAHWFVPLPDFASDTELFYRSMEEGMARQRMPTVETERIDFLESGLLSRPRTYYRMRRERLVFDLCSSPFGAGWFYSFRAASLPRSLTLFEIILTILGMGSFFALYCQHYGWRTGGMVFAASLAFLLLVFLMARRWGSLDDFLIHLPVVGALYETFVRRDTYFQQDQRLVTAHLLEALARDKIIEFCTAGGVESPEFVRLHFPGDLFPFHEVMDRLHPPSPSSHGPLPEAL